MKLAPQIDVVTLKSGKGKFLRKQRRNFDELMRKHSQLEGVVLDCIASMGFANPDDDKLGKHLWECRGRAQKALQLAFFYKPSK